MKPRPVRMPDSLWEEIQAEADAQGLGAAEYVRQILRNRQADTQPNTQPNTLPDTQALAERVDELEERLVNLEADTPTPSEATESRESAPAPEPTERPETNGGARDAATTHGPEDWVGDHLAELDFPNGRERDDCIAAATAAYLFLHERHQASMREIVEQVMPEHPIGYDVPELEPGDRYRGSWWRKIVKPALETLPDVDAPTGGGKWRWTGE